MSAVNEASPEMLSSLSQSVCRVKERRWGAHTASGEASRKEALERLAELHKSNRCSAGLMEGEHRVAFPNETGMEADLSAAENEQSAK